MTMHSGGQDAKFIKGGVRTGGKPVAFARLKADEPREAKQGGPAPCASIGRGQSGRTDPHV